MESATTMKKVFLSLLTRSFSQPLFDEIKNTFDTIKLQVENLDENEKNDEEIAITFQQSLKSIKHDWDESKKTTVANSMLDQIKSNRIKKNLEEIDVSNLLKATIISSVLSANENYKNLDKYMNYKIEEFVYQVCRSCFRKIFAYPDFFLEYEDSNRIRDNNNKILEFIEKSIIETIDEIYINDKINYYLENINEKINIYTNKNELLGGESFNNLNPAPQIINNTNKPNYFDNINQSQNNSITMNGGFNNSNEIFTNNKNENFNNQPNFVNQSNNMENKINNILKEKDIVLSDSKKYKSESSIISQITKNSNNNSNKDSSTDSKDEKIKQIVERDLGTTENIELYKAENSNDKYREIFSNSSNKNEKLNHSYSEKRNTTEKKNIINKQKFFNNYLNL